jgi:hypothetical protein
VKIVRGVYHKPAEELERVVYAPTRKTCLEQIKLKCGLRSKDWQERAGVKLDLLEFKPNVSGLIGALNQGLKDGADYGE